MKKYFVLVRIHFTSLLAILLIVGSSQPLNAQTGGILKVAVTLPDIVPIVKTIGGDNIEIFEVMPPGADPHGYTLTADAITNIENCDLIVYGNSDFFGFEKSLSEAVTGIDSIDWVDYERLGATLTDFPGYESNPHGFWLDFDNAKAIAGVISDALVSHGFDIYVVRHNVHYFFKEIDAIDASGRELFSELGRERSTWAAMVPGVLYTIDNLGLEVGGVVFTEGVGFASGADLFDMENSLRDGEYAGLVCPLSMKNAKPGEIAEQLSLDTGAPVCYVKFLDSKADDSFLAQASYNAGAMAATVAKSTVTQAAPHQSAAGNLVWAAIVGILLIAIVMQNKRIYYTAGAITGGGVFDKKKNK